jgi:hypothetical protein
MCVHRCGWTSKYAYAYLKLLERKTFDPESREQANGKSRVFICNSFGTHETLAILEFCFENNIILCRLPPSHTSLKLQPCNVLVFASLRTDKHTRGIYK